MQRRLSHTPIHHSEAAPPPGIPPGYVGPAIVPGTGRAIFWTGRVAIGMHYQRPDHQAFGHGMQALQAALLAA
jgi:hypothetical protein